MKRLVDMQDAELDDRTERLRALAGSLSPAEDSELRAARVARAIDAVAEGHPVRTTRLRLVTSAAMLAVLLVTVVAAATAVGRYRSRPSLEPVPQPAPAVAPSVRRAAPDTLLSPPPAPSPVQPPAAAAAPAPVAIPAPAPPTPPASSVAAASPREPTPQSTTRPAAPPVEAAPKIERVDRVVVVAPAPLPSAPAAARPANATKLPLDEDDAAESPLAEVAAHIADAGPARRLPDAPAVTDSGGESRLLLRAVGSLRRGDPAAAASLVEQYLRDHGGGASIEEAYALGIDAARRRGLPSSRTLAADYLRRFPDGRYARFAERVLRKSSGSSTASEPTPR